MRNKQTHRPEAHGHQQRQHGARSEFEAMREDASAGAPQYPRGYSQSQGGTSPRYGAEYGSAEDVYPRASQQWQRDENRQGQGSSFGPDYESQYRNQERMQGSQFEPYRQSGGYRQPYSDSGSASRIEPGRSTWQDPGTRRMGQGYGESSGYGQRSGYGYGQGSTDEPSLGYGYQPEFPSRPATYQGRGPRNYTRSNERILEEVNERLTDDPWLDASDITVQCVDGRVQLEGQVRDRWMKHRAEDLVDACMGVRDIDNRLRIQSSSDASSAGASADTGLSESRTTTRGPGVSGSQTLPGQPNRPAH